MVCKYKHNLLFDFGSHIYNVAYSSKGIIKSFNKKVTTSWKRLAKRNFSHLWMYDESMQDNATLLWLWEYILAV